MEELRFAYEAIVYYRAITTKRATRYTMARWHSRQELSLVNEKMWDQSPVEGIRFAYEFIVYYRKITTKR